jgi:hypothetical protein
LPPPHPSASNLASLILFDHSFRQSLFAAHIPNRAPFLPPPPFSAPTSTYHPFDFDFPRQSDEEIEARLIVVRTRDLSNLPPLTIDQKCNMVESDERLRFNAEKAREEQAKKVLK